MASDHGLKYEQEPLIDDSNTSIDDYDDDKSKRRRKYSKWRIACFILLPVEICVFLFLFAVYFQMQIYQQYYFQRIVKDSIIEYNNWTVVEANTNYSLNEMCLNQDNATEMTNKTVFLHAQKKVNDISMITSLASFIPSAFAALIVTPLTDRYGRKVAFVTVFIGQLIAAIIGVLIIYLELSIYYFILLSVVTGVSGGFGVVMAASFSYISDITPSRWLTIRMGVVEGTIFVASAVASASADKWIDRTNCDFRPMYLLSAAVVLAGLIFSVIIPESVSANVKENNSRKSLSLLIRGVKIFVNPYYVGLAKFWKLWLAMGIMFLNSIIGIGNEEITGYFLHNKPLQWSYDTIGNYFAVSSVSHMLAYIGLVPLFVLLKVPDPVMMSIGMVVASAGNLFVVFLTKTWEMFLVGTIVGVEAIIAPGLRAFAARLVRKEDNGATFSIVAAIQLLGVILASIVYNQIYTPQTTQGDHLRSPRLVYLVSASLWFLALVMTLPLICFPEKKPSKQKVELSEDFNEKISINKTD